MLLLKTVQNDFYPPPFLAFCFPKLQFSTLNQLWGSVMDYQLFSIVRKSQNYYLILIIWGCVLVLLLPYISVSVKFAWKSIITDIDRSPFLRGSQILGDNFYYYLRNNLQRRIQRHDYWLFRIFDQSVCK